MRLRIVPRSETRLPRFPDSYYQGPYRKAGICWHHMGAHESAPVTPARALEIQRVNYDYQRRRWHAIDILEGFDLFLVSDAAWALEGRPWWSNCDAFSGAGKIGNPYIGVEVSGNYDAVEPSDKIIEGMAELAARLHLEGKCGTDFSHGHRDFDNLSNVGPTSCPGRHLYPRLPEVQAEAERIIKREEEAMMMRLPDAVGKDFHFLDLWLGRLDYWLHLQLRAKRATKVAIYATRPYGQGYEHVMGLEITPDASNPNPYTKLDIGAVLRQKGITECSLSVHSQQEIACALREFQKL